MKQSILVFLLATITCISTAYPGDSGNQKLYDIRLDNYFGGSLAITDSAYHIRGQMAYIGSGTLNSIFLNYQVDDGDVITTFFDNIGINPQVPFYYEAELPWIPEDQGSYELSIWFSGLNGDPEDAVASNTLGVTVDVYDFLPERQLALIESFSSINCGSCVYVSNMLRNLIQANIDRYAMIYYHPMSHENSPLYNFNPKDQDTRRNYYEVFYTPFAAVGSFFQGNGEVVNEYLMDIAYEQPAGFTIDGSYFIEDGLLYADVETESFAYFPDQDLRLYVVLTEDSISFDSPPGSNGEQDFYHVMRTFLPGADGIGLHNQVIGSGFQIDLQYDIPPGVIDAEQIRLLVFIQDHESMEILQFVRLFDQSTPDNELYTVTFNITDENEEEVTGAVLTLGELVNDAGDYVFEDIAPGEYEYMIIHPCFTDLEGGLSVDHEDLFVEAELQLGHKPGDANGDGVVDLLDIILVANYWAGNPTDILCFQNADVNGDGLINSLDIIMTVNLFLSGNANPSAY